MREGDGLRGSHGRVVQRSERMERLQGGDEQVDINLRIAPVPASGVVLVVGAVDGEKEGGGAELRETDYRVIY